MLAENDVVVDMSWERPQGFKIGGGPGLDEIGGETRMIRHVKNICEHSSGMLQDKSGNRDQGGLRLRTISRSGVRHDTGRP